MTGLHRTPEWHRLVRKVRPAIEASLPAPCVNRCKRGGTVWPGTPFDVAHIVDAVLAPELELDPSNLGPAHPACNRSAGGRLGARRNNVRNRGGIGRERAW